MKQQTQLVVWKKLLEVRNPIYYGLRTNKVKIFDKFKANENFIDTIKKLGISKSAILFTISIVKFVNKYLGMKISKRLLHFLKNNFKIFKEICHENASEFKQVYHFLNQYLYFKIV